MSPGKEDVLALSRESWRRLIRRLKPAAFPCVRGAALRAGKLRCLSARVKKNG